MSGNVTLRRFESGEEAPAADLARLHREMLPHSPIVALGPRFMESFYYGVLPRDGAIFGAVAYYDGRPAGFIVATEDSDGFMSRAIRRHFLRLSGVMLWTIVTQPSSIAGIWETMGIMRDRGGGGRSEPVAELLSFGVLPAYRAAGFVRETGIRFGKDLMDAAMAQLLSRGCREVRALVDEDNVEVKLLYRALGWRLSDTAPAGWRTPQVEFNLRFETGPHE